MDIVEAVRVVARRWLVVLIGVLLTGGAAYAVATQTPRVYHTSAQMLLLLPAGAQGNEHSNSPFVYLPSGLTVLARMIALAPRTESFAQSMYDDGYTSQYELSVSNQEPSIAISVEGSDPQNVIDTRDALIIRIDEELQRTQAEESVPQHHWAHFRVSGLDETATPTGGSRLQAVGGTVAAGGLVTLLAAFLIDRLRRPHTRQVPGLPVAEAEESVASP